MASNLLKHAALKGRMFKGEHPQRQHKRPFIMPIHPLCGVKSRHGSARDNLVVYIADGGNGRIRRVDEATGIITTAAGSGDGGSPEQVALAMPRQVSVDASGHLYVADTWNNRILKISTNPTARGGRRGLRLPADQPARESGQTDGSSEPLLFIQTAGARVLRWRGSIAHRL
jgi:hypothetical protein